MRRGALGLLAGLLLACRRDAAPTPAPAASASSAEARAERWITVGPAVTEVVFAAGAGGAVVAVDSSSAGVPGAAALASVGYQRQLSAEGILALRPTRLLVTADAGPPAALTQLREAGVTVTTFPSATTLPEARARIAAVAAAIGRDPAPLLRPFDEQLAAVSADRDRPCRHQKVLIAYTRGGGPLHGFGAGTPPAALLAAIGAENGAAFEGSRPLGPELLVAGGGPALLVVPKSAEEAAPRAPGRAVLAVADGALLALGLHTPDAARAIAQALCPSTERTL